MCSSIIGSLPAAYIINENGYRYHYRDLTLIKARPAIYIYVSVDAARTLTGWEFLEGLYRFGLIFAEAY
jgi:hypothetical protein